MNRGTRARRFALLVVAVPVLALTVACDDNGADVLEATPAPEAAQTATPTATPAETPSAGEPASTPTPEPQAAQSGAAAIIEVSTGGELAPFLVDAEGLTLYLFTVDEPGRSNCEGVCIENWPALTVDSEADLAAGTDANGALGVIERADDGTLQVTYNGWPLYYWIADSVPGDTKGHEVNNVWFVVAPDVDPLGEDDAGAASGDGGDYYDY